MRLLDWIAGLFGGQTEQIAEAIIDQCAPARCVSATGLRQRHLFKGDAFCTRGCGAENPDYAAPVAVPSEGL